MQYEILAETATGLEMPRYYENRFYDARQAACELAEELSEDGHTGRATVRNAHDEAVISVRVRGPLALIWEHRSGDLPVAYWNGVEFDYFEASRRYQDSPQRAFLQFKPMQAGSMSGGTFIPA